MDSADWGAEREKGSTFEFLKNTFDYFWSTDLTVSVSKTLISVSEIKESMLVF